MSTHSVEPLRQGDLVAIIAPAGPFDRPSFEAGLQVLSQRYRPVFGEGLFSARRYLAGDDRRRLAELQGALSNPDVRAVFAARGGYGVMRLLPELTGPLPRKPLVGFSDLTALHALFTRQSIRSLHGPVLTQLGRAPPDVVARLYALLESAQLAEPLTGSQTLVPGVVEGPLVGGNLSVLTRLIGTPWLPTLTGAVLLLEDVGERPYRLDRMWTHLKLAGLLDDVAGIVLGDFTSCEEQGADYGPLDVLAELAAALGKPCAAGFPVGHTNLNQPVPLGARVRLDAAAQRLEFLEPLVSPP